MPHKADEALCKTTLLLSEGNVLVAFAETLHTTSGIDDLLLTREKRMAVGADFNVQFVFGRPGVDHVATKTSDGAVDVFRMNILFHFSCYLLGLIL